MFFFMYILKTLYMGSSYGGFGISQNSYFNSHFNCNCDYVIDSINSMIMIL